MDFFEKEAEDLFESPLGEEALDLLPASVTHNALFNAVVPGHHVNGAAQHPAVAQASPPPASPPVVSPQPMSPPLASPQPMIPPLASPQPMSPQATSPQAIAPMMMAPMMMTPQMMSPQTTVPQPMMSQSVVSQPIAAQQMVGQPTFAPPTGPPPASPPVESPQPITASPMTLPMISQPMTPPPQVMTPPPMSPQITGHQLTMSDASGQTPGHQPTMSEMSGQTIISQQYFPQQVTPQQISPQPTGNQMTSPLVSPASPDNRKGSMFGQSSTTFRIAPLPGGNNAVVVVPANNPYDVQPRYHISVHTNVFKAHTPVTTVRRGGAENGPVIATTMLTGHAVDGKITIGPQTRKLKKSVDWRYKPGQRDRIAEMVWKLCRVELSWEPVPGVGETLYRCSTGGKMNKKYIATMRLPNHTRTEEELTIEVSETELGEEVMDHIIVSSLVFQRGQDDGERARSMGGLNLGNMKFGRTAGAMLNMFFLYLGIPSPFTGLR